MKRFKYLMSSLLFAGALMTSPAFADDDAINSPEIRPTDEHTVMAMSDMQEVIEPSESFDVASLTYCWAGSVFDETTGQNVDLYNLCQAELYDIA